MAESAVPPVDPPGADALAEQRRLRDDHLAGLLARSAGGDAVAFEAFYDICIVHARTLARRMLRDADLDDVLADAFFQAWREASRYDARRGGPLTWLLTIVRTRALDCLRQRAVRFTAGNEDEADAIASDQPGPAELLAQVQAGSRVQRALAELSAQERWLLALAYYRDLTHAQIAATTALPLGTVKSCLLRAQQKLRERLADIGPAAPLAR
ncbi:MAG: sigma-70 family RNA polymerase sigma factor [Ideonella sp.]|nr:sigma-70 family RNA polymerase sigma factor [Ideonella sp.]MCC7455684.1 sigma-70 family RNA polymerase sigma factor [Nitrospira sp.]